ncbi:hypothetical protein, partial [Kosakonia cowanii]|uniref:hypothetical protein n=1 Tax=Kosakonia cowanii TaxID=208223 RepID=UPI0028AAB522
MIQHKKTQVRLTPPAFFYDKRDNYRIFLTTFVADWKSWCRHLFLRCKATKPALMPTFSARLSPKSHFP